MTSILLGFPEYRVQGQALARTLGLEYMDVGIHRFPDGESRVRLAAALPERVLVCRSLDRPNDKLVELALVAETARTLGARHLTLIAPYLCYMRQDRSFHPGEAVSQRIVGRLLARWFDALVTVDPHLHRVHSLREAVPVEPALALTATAPMADFLGERLEAPLLVGPDAESEQWVAAIAARGGVAYRVARKQRYGDREVVVKLPEGPYSGQHLVLVDDVASTGRTLEAAARELSGLKPASISVLVTHALFVGDALERLRLAGVSAVWSSDSIPHPTNALPLAPLLAAALDQGKRPRVTA